MLRKFLARKPAVNIHALPEGMRIYAVGDIHGRRDCLDVLLNRIDRDDAARGPALTQIVFLGDLNDRGPDSRSVIERLIVLHKLRESVFLMGNHEEILIRAWEGEVEATRLFHRVGGRETLRSYGVTAEDYDAATIGDLTQMVRDFVPESHIDFLRGFQDYHVAGDYLFVHAGVKPGLPIESQSPSDMRWIRQPFLDDDRNHGHMVVHGHSVTEAPDERDNRIGIDTGAFASGILTALGVEGTDRWLLST